METIKKILQTFSNYQSVYYKGQKVADGARTDKRVALIDWDTMVKNNMSVLDLGCSNGALALEAARRGLQVVAVERSDCLNTGRIVAEAEGLDNIKFIQADIESREFKDWCPKFDAIFFMAMLTHMKDQKEMLRWIDRHCLWGLWYETNFQQNVMTHMEMIDAYTSFKLVESRGESEIYPNSYTLLRCLREAKLINH